MIAENDKTYITVKTSVNQGSDIILRILESIEVMQAKGYKVVSVGCSSKLFMKISKKVARITGIFDEERILLKLEQGEPIPLVNDKRLIYNDNKQFYLRIVEPISKKMGTAFPTFNQPVKIIGD